MISPNKCIKLKGNDGPVISDFNNENRQKYNIKCEQITNIILFNVLKMIVLNI